MSSWKEKRRVKKCYNLTSNIYNKRYFEEQKDKYNYVLEKLKIKSDNEILDVGCGSGLLFSFLESTVEMIVGIDISIRLLKEVKRKNKKNIHLVLADADFLPFKNKKFDIIFAFTILQNMPIPVNTLKEIKSKAKDEGKIIVTGLKKVYSLKKFRELIANAGFNPLIMETNAKLKDHIAINVKSEFN